MVDQAICLALREVGLVALARGWNAETLAAAYNAQEPATRVNGKNIRDSFRGKKPRLETLRRYALALGTHLEHLLLANGNSIESARVRMWRGYALMELDDARGILSTFSGAVASEWDRDKLFELACLQAYALSSYRFRNKVRLEWQSPPRHPNETESLHEQRHAFMQRHGMNYIHGKAFYFPIATLLQQLGRRIETKSYFFSEDPRPDSSAELSMIDYSLSMICSDEQRLSVLEIIRALARANGREAKLPDQFAADLKREAALRFARQAPFPGTIA